MYNNSNENSNDFFYDKTINKKLTETNDNYNYWTLNQS